MVTDEVVPFINAEFPWFLRQRNGQFRRLWWAQDGAPPHQRIIVRDRLQELFGNWVIALNQPVEWRPLSPDLIPWDFFLWGYLKSWVYTTPPANLDDLQNRIIREVDLIHQDSQMIRQAVTHMLRTNKFQFFQSKMQFASCFHVCCDVLFFV